jgi:hypothetical protein
MTKNEAITILMLVGDAAAEDAWFDLSDAVQRANLNALALSNRVAKREVGGAGVEFIPADSAVTEARTVFA